MRSYFQQAFSGVSVGNTDLNWTMLAALTIVETDDKDVLTPGKPFGWFQIRFGPNPDARYLANDPFNLQAQADWSAKKLATNATSLAKMFPNLSAADLRQATADSWRTGLTGEENRINSGLTYDPEGTNYGRSVVDIMSCFQ